MNVTISELESGLKDQLSKLTTEIRATEASLMSAKEGYLKVQGALEVLEILSKKLIDSDIALKEALSDLGAD